jgi:PiT family inorganic phosphate transporter
MMLSGLFLILAIGLALGFEFVNGFHDTANAVATVIYTNTLRPRVAVVWSGIWNLIGVLTSTGAVAFGIVALLPIDLVLNVGSSIGFAMVFALLISAILWNIGTWYLGLPASSSHTLIGSIMGVGLASAMMSKSHTFAEGINWIQVRNVFTTLLVSPIVGFVCAALLLLVMKWLVRKPDLYRTPPKGTPPPLTIRGLLVLTCTGVSFAHGSNDGQKGMGLIVLILVGILPGAYALKMNAPSSDVRKIAADANIVAPWFDSRAAGASVTADQAADQVSGYLKNDGQVSNETFAALATLNRQIAGSLNGRETFRDLRADEVKSLRKYLYLVSGAITKLKNQNLINDATQDRLLASYKSELVLATQYIPDWVKFAVAIALGFGTMIGWKRIVVTVGEKIGKEHLNYAQGASAELVAMATIFAADRYGLPVSTTHVLSSGVAGTMAANHSGLQLKTLRNLLLAWIFTLPVCVLLGATTFAGGLFLIFTSTLVRIFTIMVALAVLCLIWILWRSHANRPRRPRSETFEPTASAPSV